MRVSMTARAVALSLSAVIVAGGLAASTVAVNAREIAASSADNGGSIKVRGHWVIDVRDPDGSLVSQTEFDNSLAPGFGGQMLARLLTQQGPMGRWTIRLSGSANPCAGGTLFNGPAAVCYIVDSTAAQFPPGTAAFRTLTTSIVNSTVVLAGNFTALANGQIDNVQTLNQLCSATTTGGNCSIAGTGTVPFTTHDLVTAQGSPAPLVVAAGQIVQVTVTISFCSSTGCQS